MNDEEFRAKMAALPEPPRNVMPPHWDAWRHDLWTRAQIDTPRNFMKWPCVYHTMLQDHWPQAIDHELSQLNSLFRQAAAPFTPWESDVVPDKGLSRNLVHQLYHLKRMMAHVPLENRNVKHVLEFGGGYGAMAAALKRYAGDMPYTIVDLPEFLLLQEWWLSQAGIENVEFLTWEQFIDDLAAQQGGGPFETDLLIACYSLSEIPLAMRDEFFGRVSPQAVLFLYSNKFEEYDNIAYFHNHLAGGIPEYKWRHERVEHLPPESWYTFGWAR